MGATMQGEDTLISKLTWAADPGQEASGETEGVAQT
jgi:hypothetical protein